MVKGGQFLKSDGKRLADSQMDTLFRLISEGFPVINDIFSNECLNVNLEMADNANNIQCKITIVKNHLKEMTQPPKANNDSSSATTRKEWSSLSSSSSNDDSSSQSEVDCILQSPDCPLSSGNRPGNLECKASDSASACNKAVSVKRKFGIRT